VHFLRKHLTNRTIASVSATHDEIVYGKVGTSAAAFEKAMTGKTVLDARQQGKYFWLVMSSPPHPLMHFGMTGWVKFSNDDSGAYKEKKSDEGWPPRFCKFVLTMKGDPACEVAFVDARRLGRIRLVDVPAAEMRKTSPLKENGPDPVIDKDILTREWLRAKMRSKKVPVKALLLDQANISGVGNWVADEVLYQARIHPEQYSNTFSDEQLNRLHDKLIEVCTTACETLADTSQFPEDWLMKHRWSKGKKDMNRLPNGEKIMHITVGGRTSAIVPSVQKKTGAVAADVDENDEDDADVEEKPKKGKGKTKKAVNGTNGETPTKTSARGRGKQIDYNEESEEDEEVKKPKGQKRKSVNDETPKKSKKMKAEEELEKSDRRRSGRKSNV
jgi:formamidopyrimidine-DNA glycosylase